VTAVRHALAWGSRRRFGDRGARRPAPAGV